MSLEWSGIGRIFDQFLHGELEDDDEVAVAHCPAEFGYRPTSVAMVNIRSTLTAARANAVVSDETSKQLEHIAKNLFYPNRCYELILNAAASEKLPALELKQFADWLPSGAVDQKRLDAVAMLQTIDREMVCDPQPKRVKFFFEHSWAWEQLVRESTSTAGNHGWAL